MRSLTLRCADNTFLESILEGFVPSSGSKERPWDLGPSWGTFTMEQFINFLKPQFFCLKMGIIIPTFERAGGCILKCWV